MINQQQQQQKQKQQLPVSSPTLQQPPGSQFLPMGRIVNDEFGIHRVDLTSRTAWSCVAATLLFIACSIIIFSMRNKAVAFASLSLFVAYAGVVILLFVPRPKSFDCELMLIIWTTWIAYGILLKDTEWVFSGALSIIPTLAVLVIVFITYLPTVEKNRKFTSVIIFLFFFLLLFPQKEGLAFLISVGSILLHTVIFVVLFLVQDYEIVYRYGGHPIFNTKNRILPTTLQDIGTSQSDQYYLYFISLKIIRTIWTLLVNRLSLLFVIIQIIYLVRSIYFIRMKGDGRAKAPPIVNQQQQQQQQQQQHLPPAPQRQDANYNPIPPSNHHHHHPPPPPPPAVQSHSHNSHIYHSTVVPHQTTVPNIYLNNNNSNSNGFNPLLNNNNLTSNSVNNTRLTVPTQNYQQRLPFRSNSSSQSFQQQQQQQQLHLPQRSTTPGNTKTVTKTIKPDWVVSKTMKSGNSNLNTVKYNNIKPVRFNNNNKNQKYK